MEEWLTKHWRDVISVVGFILTIAGLAYTIYLAQGAKTAAMAAEEASKSAKSRMNSVSWSLRFSDLMLIVDDLLENTNNSPNWRDFSRKCTEIRTHASVADQSWFHFFDDETKQKLKISATQFARMAQRADAFLVSKPKEADLSSLRRTLTDQRVLFAICFEKLKHDASGGDNV